ncbi:hypothetical protein CEY12_03885 [Chryseobacterium sp. T16E-39]|uniref:DUF6150 family protein n=1 Tax=Chryseobacterium sp. T16E-39 TaxID=2015076 RepID=UPI000B5B192A|nr:DUF6150 family protein [Chryseobacterium sp. T16E-39]ASK29297.1 hypothetical protein CEY12_03885 [Chryseobacterium sp. T16E-39]
MPSISIKNFQSKNDLVVYETDVESAADLLVYKTDSKLKALENEAFWYFEKFENSSDRSICFSNSKAAADLSIHYVNDDASARWQGEHPLKGKLKS